MAKIDQELMVDTPPEKPKKETPLTQTQIARNRVLIMLAEKNS